MNPRYSSILRSLSTAALALGIAGVAGAGCSLGTPANAYSFSCVVPPTGNSVYARATYDVVYSGCAADVSPTMCQSLCKKAFQYGNCAAVQTLVGYLTPPVVEIAQGTVNNACAGGTLVGPASPTTFQNQPAYAEGCFYADAAEKTCSVPQSGAASQGLTVAGSVARYRAGIAGGSIASVQADSDASARGQLFAGGVAQGLAFDMDAGTLSLRELELPVLSFAYAGNGFAHGHLRLVNAGAASVTGADTYAIAAGQATFELQATASNGSVVVVNATNDTPLVVSLAGAAGPTLTGRLAGALEGQAIHADLAVAFTWAHRPPVAVAHATGLTYDSSTSPNASQHSQFCVTSSGTQSWSWFGDSAMKTTVTLDASGSYEPDGGSALTYAWNGAAPSPSPTAAMQVGAGKHSASLVVTDAFGVQTETEVTFEVVDKAFVAAPQGCGAIAVIHPGTIVRPQPPVVDPLPIHTIGEIRNLGH